MHIWRFAPRRTAKFQTGSSRRGRSEWIPGRRRVAGSLQDELLPGVVPAGEGSSQAAFQPAAFAGPHELALVEAGLADGRRGYCAGCRLPPNESTIPKRSNTLVKFFRVEAVEVSVDVSERRMQVISGVVVYVPLDIERSVVVLLEIGSRKGRWRRAGRLVLELI